MGKESHYTSTRDRVFVRGIEGQYSLQDELARLRAQPRVIKGREIRFMDGPPSSSTHFVEPVDGLTQTLHIHLEEYGLGGRNQKHGHVNEAAFYIDWQAGDVAIGGVAHPLHDLRGEGGFVQYVYLPWNAVLHKVPAGVSPELPGSVTPLANGIEWALFDSGVGYASTVLIQGPGQQGLSQVVACKQAVADLIVVTALKRKGGMLLVQGEMTDFPNFPIGKVTVKYITIKSARGHSFTACALELQQLASHRFPLELVTTHTFGLADADLAIKSVGGAGAKDVIHVSLMPWK